MLRLQEFSYDLKHFADILLLLNTSGSSKYGVLLEIMFALSVDQGIIYGSFDEVDTAYSSKSGNGHEFV
uniref:Uncharacterized protein n=1 Tax=Tanacetum cinerariifolium TaxID=118510 RepID=A0A699JRQ5_TANCI|nr:hypothetical protein [Tanacetum cinerariifolium]